MTTDLLPPQSVPNDAASSREQYAALENEFVATLETLNARGLHDNAEALAREMTRLLPENGVGWKTLAYSHLRRGELAAALAPLVQATALLPQDAELAQHLQSATAMQDALALDQQGEYRLAGLRYQEVLAAYPDHPDANHKLGVVAIRLDQPEAAVPYLEKALGIKPNEHQIWVHYLDALLQSGQTKAAWMALEMAQQRGLQGPVVDKLITLMTAMSSVGFTMRRKPMDAGDKEIAPPPEARTGAAAVPPEAASGVKPATRKAQTATPSAKQTDALVTLFNGGRIEEAAAGARKFVELFPAHGIGWKVLGLALSRLGRHDEAMQYLPTAHELFPTDVDVLQVSSCILESKGQHAEAEAECLRLLEVAPNHAEGLRILGIIMMSTGRLGEAEKTCRKAQEAAPDSPLPCLTLGVIHMKQGRLGEAIVQFRRAVELDPNNDQAYNNLAFCLTQSEDVSPQELFAQHRRFGERFEVPLEPHWPRHGNSRDPERRLRVGFISGDFCNHAVASFLEPLVEHLCRDSSLSLHAFSNTSRDDEVTARLRKHFEHWHHIFGMPDDQAARLIQAKEIDILIDLAGHTANNRLLVMARKPAPLQALAIGYPGTTGLKAVDYFLADRFWVPPELKNQFTEQIAYLPAFAPFLPGQLCPPVNLLPALRNGYVTFGSFNRMDKINREIVALWSQVLRAVPDSRMLIGAMPPDGSIGALIEWFAAEGIARERLDCRPRASTSVYLQQHHHVDFCLDTFPFSGLTTALHSLWMGVPTLTLPGLTVPGRSGLTAMSHVGLEAFVATDKADFVRRGAALAADVTTLAELRAGMRARCEQSPVFRPDALADGVSRALRVMWRRWCDGLPAESFDVSDAQPLERLRASQS